MCALRPSGTAARVDVSGKEEQKRLPTGVVPRRFREGPEKVPAKEEQRYSRHSGARIRMSSRRKLSSREQRPVGVMAAKAVRPEAVGAREDEVGGGPRVVLLHLLEGVLPPAVQRAAGQSGVEEVVAVAEDVLRYRRPL